MIRRFFDYIIDSIKRFFLTGFLTLLPIALTIALFTTAFRIINNWVHPVYHITPQFLKNVPHSEIIFVIIAIFIIGAVIKILLLEPFIETIESLFSKIPLVSQIYFGIKQIVFAWGPQDEVSFQQIILIEFPRSGVYSLGFITGIVPPSLTPNKDIKFYSIFIPNTPNPTTGYYIIAPQDECVPTPLTRQEAMSIIISGGIITPDRFIKEKRT